MGKIFIGGDKSCGIHNEADMIKSLVRNVSKWEIVNDYRNADIIIIIETCMSTYSNLVDSISYVENVLNEKNKDSRVVVSGCLARGTKFELNEKQKSILNRVTCVKSDKIIECVCNLIGIDSSKGIVDEYRLPFSISGVRMAVSPVSGCLNHCSFCKSNYINFNLNSIPFNYLEKVTRDINELNSYGIAPNYMSISSSNLSLYGVDLYKRQMADKAIRELTSSDSIKFAEVGAIINFYPELIREILENEKIKYLFTSLESGSPRIYNLMNRPISLERWKNIIRTIRENRPDIMINTEFICGFPTETIDDLKMTIDTIYELDINPQFMHPYCNSHCIPSSKLDQHTPWYCLESSRYAKDRLKDIRNRYRDFVLNGEMYVIDIDEVARTYIVLMIDGNVREISFDRFDKRYNVGDMIDRGLVKSKTLVKHMNRRR